MVYYYRAYTLYRVSLKKVALVVLNFSLTYVNHHVRKTKSEVDVGLYMRMFLLDILHGLLKPRNAPPPAFTHFCALTFMSRIALVDHHVGVHGGHFPPDVGLQHVQSGRPWV